MSDGSAADPGEVTEDAMLDGRLRLVQPRKGHRAGSDAVLLAAACGEVGGETVADFGAGVGAVGLMVAARHPACRVVLVENDPGLAALARRNVALNRFEGRMDVCEADILAPASARRKAGLTAGSAGLVVTNPPFWPAGRVRSSPDAARRAAHVMADEALEGWLRATADLLAPDGRLVLIHRVDGLAGLLAALAGRFGDIAVRPVYSAPDRPAVRLLVCARKGSRAPMRLLPGFVLNGADGRFTPEANAVHRGTASVEMV